MLKGIFFLWHEIRRYPQKKKKKKKKKGYFQNFNWFQFHVNLQVLHDLVHWQGLDFDANQRIDSRRDSRHTIAARIKVDSRERYHD